jgi:HlyD family secretion protein
MLKPLKYRSSTIRACSGSISASRLRVSVVLACPGRVEGASDVINVGAGADGVIAEIRVVEGQAVHAGDVLAVISRRDLNAELSAARAHAEAARQARARILRGSRDEERRKAEAEVSAIQAMQRQAQLRYDRYEKLFRQGVISEDQLDEAKKNLDVAEADLRATVKHKELVDAPRCLRSLSAQRQR